MARLRGGPAAGGGALQREWGEGAPQRPGEGGEAAGVARLGGWREARGGQERALPLSSLPVGEWLGDVGCCSEWGCTPVTPRPCGGICSADGRGCDPRGGRCPRRAGGGGRQEGRRPEGPDPAGMTVCAECGLGFLRGPGVSPVAPRAGQERRPEPPGVEQLLRQGRVGRAGGLQLVPHRRRLRSAGRDFVSEAADGGEAAEGRETLLSSRTGYGRAAASARLWARASRLRPPRPSEGPW